MLAVYVILGIIALILLLLICPVRFKFSYDDELKVSAGYLFLKYSIVPARPKSAKKIKKQKKEKLTKEKDSSFKEIKKNPFKKMVEEDGFAAAISETCRLIKLLLNRLRILLSHTVIKKLRLSISVGGDDAADTAIQYGGVCAAVYPLVGIAASFVKLQGQQIDIAPDYSESKSEIKIAFTAKLRLFHILSAAIYAAVKYIKIKLENTKIKKDGAVNE